MTNFLGFTSDTIVHQLTKEVGDADVLVELIGSDYVYPDDVIQMKTIVTPTPCATIQIASKIVRGV